MGHLGKQTRVMAISIMMGQDAYENMYHILFFSLLYLVHKERGPATWIAFIGCMNVNHSIQVKLHKPKKKNKNECIPINSIDLGTHQGYISDAQELSNHIIVSQQHVVTAVTAAAAMVVIVIAIATISNPFDPI